MIRRLGIAEDPVHSARSQPCIFMQSWCVLYAAHPTLFGCEINSNKPDYINNGANLPTAFQGYPHPNCETSRATRRVDKANFFTRDLYPTIVECNSIYIVPAQGHVSNSSNEHENRVSCGQNNWARKEWPNNGAKAIPVACDSGHRRPEKFEHRWRGRKTARILWFAVRSGLYNRRSER